MSKTDCNIKVENALFNWKLRMFLSLWELFPDLTNRKAWNHIQSQIRNSSQYPPIRTGKFSIENSMSGKHLSWITDKQLFWNVCLSSSINHAWMCLHNGLLYIIPSWNFANIDCIYKNGVYVLINKNLCTGDIEWKTS